MVDQPLRYLEVKRKLEAELAKLAPHTRLPSRPAIAKRYEAARTTVERAISELIGEGLLYARDGSGTYVAERGAARSGGLPAGAGSAAAWGLVIPDIQSYIYPGIVRGAEDVAHDRSVNLIICNTDNRYDKQRQVVERLLASDVQGMLIVPAIEGEADLSPFLKLRDSGIPFVFLHRSVEGVSASKVVTNNFFGGYMAVRHLLNEGRRRIAYISRPWYTSSAERYQGYLSALAEGGVAVDEQLVRFEESFHDPGQGYASMRDLLQLPEPPDAVFCFNDELALGVYRALEEAGLTIGGDIAVVGCDDTPACESLPVSLTSVCFPTYEIGRQAALLLAGSTSMRSLVLQPELKIRASSTGEPPVRGV